MDKIIKIGSRKSKLQFDIKLSEVVKNENDIVLLDKKLRRYYKFNSKKIFEIEAAESNKSLKTIKSIYDFFLENKVNRKSNIYVVGGGVTLDLGAFAVSTFKRGCNLILVPTTLLAMVDAALGGKTAVNYKSIKNLIGTFYPADEILFDFNFLQTLPKHEIQNGIAEILKTALISQNGLLNLILSNSNILFYNKEIIIKTVLSKLEFCKLDPYDFKERRYLNFGHTFAHIIESLSDYQVSHGIAVAFGILAASYLSFKMRYLSYENYSFIKKMILKFDLSGLLPIKNNLLNIDDSLIISDKKNDDKINLILLKDLYKPFLYKTGKINIVKDIIQDTFGQLLN